MSATRWQQIVESFRRGIESGRWQYGDRLPSEDELARQWGVSRTTVHRAMQELQRMGLVERWRRSGTFVASRKSRRLGCIALLLHHSHDQLEMDYLRGVHDGLPEEVRLIVCNTRGDAAREAHYLRRMAHEADGIILFPTCEPENTPLLTRLVESGKPIVCLDRFPEGVLVDSFVTDNYGSTLEALRYLISQGAHPVAHLTHPYLHISSVRERLQAFVDAMSEAGYHPPERWIRQLPAVPSRYQTTATQMVADAIAVLRAEQPAMRAVFCVNDYHLIAVIEACERMNLRIPDDLQVLTYHDSLSLLPQWKQRLHRLVQQPCELGKRAAERLRSLLEGHASSPVVERIAAQFYPMSSDITH